MNKMCVLEIQMKWLFLLAVCEWFLCVCVMQEKEKQEEERKAQVEEEEKEKEKKDAAQKKEVSIVKCYFLGAFSVTFQITEIVLFGDVEYLCLCCFQRW